MRKIAFLIALLWVFPAGAVNISDVAVIIEEEEYYPPIFDVYPGLREEVPWIHLGIWPTPLQKLEAYGEAVGLPNLWLKNDGLSSDLYGGNKLRKLEFLLADAKAKGYKTLIASGAVGTNSGLATCIHARRLGIKTILLTSDQPNAQYARDNMLLDLYFGAKMVYAPSDMDIFSQYVQQYITNSLKEPSYLIFMGATCPLSCIGWANAAFELKEQVEEGLMAEPDYIFLALGSMGTAAGLHVGCKLAGLKTEVIPIPITEPSDARLYALLIAATNLYMKMRDPSVPFIGVNPSEITFPKEHIGKEYAMFTPEGCEAVRMMMELEGVHLDGTYTGKAMAGAVDWLKKNHQEDKVSLFINTKNAVDLRYLTQDLDYHDLPRGYWKYFEEPIQQEDQKLEEYLASYLGEPQVDPSVEAHIREMPPISWPEDDVPVYSSAPWIIKGIMDFISTWFALPW